MGEEPHKLDDEEDDHKDPRKHRKQPAQAGGLGQVQGHPPVEVHELHIGAL